MLSKYAWDNIAQENYRSSRPEFFFLSGFSFTNIHESQDCRKKGRHFFNSNSASTQTQTTPDSPISSEQPIDFIVNDTKDEEINNLNAEVKALKSFITEQLYV